MGSKRLGSLGVGAGLYPTSTFTSGGKFFTSPPKSPGGGKFRFRTPPITGSKTGLGRMVWAINDAVSSVMVTVPFGATVTTEFDTYCSGAARGGSTTGTTALNPGGSRAFAEV